MLFRSAHENHSSEVVVVCGGGWPGAVPSPFFRSEAVVVDGVGFWLSVVGVVLVVAWWRRGVGGLQW